MQKSSSNYFELFRIKLNTIENDNERNAVVWHNLPPSGTIRAPAGQPAASKVASRPLALAFKALYVMCGGFEFFTFFDRRKHQVTTQS